MTRGEFRLLAKNTSVFLVLWDAGGIAVLQATKCAEAGSNDLFIQIDDRFGFFKPVHGRCEFRVGSVFKTFSDAFAQAVRYQKHPPENWPQGDRQFTIP